MEALEIFEAAGRGDAKRLLRLLEAGGNPNAAHPSYGNTPLSRACFTDRLEIVRLLLEHGADPNMRLTYQSPVDGRREEDVVALMFSRSESVVSALLDAGADPNAQAANGDTPLMRAALGNSPSAVRLLLAAGGDPRKRNKEGDTAASLVRKRIEWHDGSAARGTAEGRRRRAELDEIHALLEKATNESIAE